MPAVDDPVLPFRLVVDRGALRVVLAEAHARLDEDAVDLVAHDRNRRHVGERDVVKPAHGRAAESAAGRLGEVVVLGGLVVDGGDPAVGVGAEGVLRGRVGVSARIRTARRAGRRRCPGSCRPTGAGPGRAGRCRRRTARAWCCGRPRRGRRRRRRCRTGLAAWGRSSIGPVPACCAIVNVAPISVSASAKHESKIDSRFHGYPICLAGFHQASGIFMVAGVAMQADQ